jgi:hypothetical protein
VAQGATTAETEQPELGRPAGPVPTSALGGLGLAVVLCAQLVVVLDFSIVNVALPDISSELVQALRRTERRVVGTAGVTDDEQGLASALVNASRQVGSAVGVAALLSIAAAQTAGGSTTASAAGYRLAMGVAAGLAVVATVISAVFVHDRTAGRHHERPRTASRRTVAAPGTAQVRRRAGGARCRFGASSQVHEPRIRGRVMWSRPDFLHSRVVPRYANDSEEEERDG